MQSILGHTAVYMQFVHTDDTHTHRILAGACMHNFPHLKGVTRGLSFTLKWTTFVICPNSGGKEVILFRLRFRAVKPGRVACECSNERA